MKSIVNRISFVSFSKYLLSLLFVLTTSTLLQAVPQWTILVYVQASNNLHQFAEKNLFDMATVGSNENLNVLVQFHNQHHKNIWRYKIAPNKLVLDEKLPMNTDGNQAKDLVDSMRWAVTKYPAHNYFLILWNHGIGILDPFWGNTQPNQQAPTFAINSPVPNNPRIQIAGLTTKKQDMLTDVLTSEHPKHLAHRGILFNEYSRTYMSNFILTSALAEIKTNVLNNRKIDILGMDACLMAMIEVGYQVRDYAHYLVASEEVELAHGWNYAPLLQALGENSLSPEQAAQTIVYSYEHYYKKKIHFYTQSAVNLEKIELIKEHVDSLIETIKSYTKSQQRVLFKALKQARTDCLQFSVPTYVDLHSFLTEFKKQICNTSTQEYSQITQILDKASTLIEQSVVANTSGKLLSRAKGLSIYFPQSSVDVSYAKTDFAHNSQWLSLLQASTH
jgi:hypothetical protein